MNCHCNCNNTAVVALLERFEPCLSAEHSDYALQHAAIDLVLNFVVFLWFTLHPSTSRGFVHFQQLGIVHTLLPP